MPDTDDLYEILQVHPTAHPDVIQAAYRRLAMLYHPDRNPSTEAAEVKKRLNHAYGILGDPDRRAEYDRARVAQQRRGTGTGGRYSYSRSRTSGPTFGSTLARYVEELHTKAVTVVARCASRAVARVNAAKGILVAIF